MKKLVVGSYNPKKLKELKDLLFDLPVELLSLNNFKNIVEVEEDGSTFWENAAKKALGYAQQTKTLALADDSGLTVDYLEGAPGIWSARFAGAQKDDLKNCEKLLDLLKGIPKEKRTAQFRCAVALARPDKIVSVFEESVSGLIAESLLGKNGFGYDPLFFYPDFGTTFANVPPEQKHFVSHRGKALGKMKEVLQEYLKKNVGAH